MLVNVKLSNSTLNKNNLPEGFIYLSDLAPEIMQYVMYAKADNFIGRPIQGYEREVIICTAKAGELVKLANAELNKFGLGLKVYDFYRPDTACKNFVEWSKIEHDQKMKKEFYPNIDKKDFFKLGYIAEASGHSRGSTVDLTIIELATQKELDMGTRIDFLDEASHTENINISQEAKKNRLLLRLTMQKYGFENYSKEWWHFSLNDEPFKRKPEDHFDFPVK